VNSNMGALVRYWWVLLIGLLGAAGVGVVAVYAKQEPLSYLASARVLVTSSDAPYYRTSVTTVTQRGAATAPDSTILNTNPPDVQTLVRAANLYPILIESDLVVTEREDLFGVLPGVVDARAVFAIETANRFEQSSIPVIQISATAARPADATAMADATVSAFTSWIGKQQAESGVKDEERVLIAPLSSARVENTIGGPVYGIPTLLAIAVFLGFCGLAVLLDALSRRAQLQVATPGTREQRTTV
jgi:hypothetical protein